MRRQAVGQAGGVDFIQAAGVMGAESARAIKDRKAEEGGGRRHQLRLLPDLTKAEKCTASFGCCIVYTYSTMDDGI